MWLEAAAGSAVDVEFVQFSLGVLVQGLKLRPCLLYLDALNVL